MSRIDTFLAKMPGSTGAKAFLAALAIGAAVAYPVFRSKEGRQGHDYFSSERPEAISAGQDHMRKQNRIERGLVLDSTTSSDGSGTTTTTSAGKKQE